MAARRPPKRAPHEHDHDEGRRANLLQGLGPRAAHRVQSRLATQRGGLGRPDDLLRVARFSMHRARPPRPRAIDPDVGRQRDGHLCRRSGHPHREARPEECDSRGSLDGRRRGRPVHRPSRRRPREGPRRQGGPRGRRAPDHGQDGRQSRRAAARRLRRLSRDAAGRSGAVLQGHPRGSVLRLQSPRREGVAGHHRQLVAAGHDVRASRLPTTASRPSARPISPRTSRSSMSPR